MSAWSRRPAVAARAAVVLTVSAVAAVLVVPGPAHAYSPSWDETFAQVNTTQSVGCDQNPDYVFDMDIAPAGCSLPDSIDGTLFQYDTGGRAWKCVLRSGGAIVAKVEFHPYDEKLWIYDTRNDGDTIYVTVVWEDDPIVYRVGPPSTGNVRDVRVIDIDPDGSGPYPADLPEGDAIGITVADESDGGVSLCGDGNEVAVA